MCLGDIRGKRALVLGCGGGQDVVALVKLGAVAVGIDSSPKQLAYARKFAQGRDADNASFVEGGVEDLSRFDDASFDLAVSIHVLDYVERVEDALSQAARVLKPAACWRSRSSIRSVRTSMARRPCTCGTRTGRRMRTGRGSSRMDIGASYGTTSAP